MSSLKREKIIAELFRELRFISANSVMFSQAAAQKAGLHSTDMESLDLLLLGGPKTAGELGRLTGLTSGAVTALIDRLEGQKYVRRQPDAKDRRRVVVVADEARIEKDLNPIMQSMGEASANLMEEFRTEELDVILRFLRGSNALAQSEIEKLR